MKPTVTKDSSDSMESTESPWYQLFIELVKTNIVETPDPPLVRCKEFIGSVYKTLNTTWKQGK